MFKKSDYFNNALSVTYFYVLSFQNMTKVAFRFFFSIPKVANSNPNQHQAALF